MPVARIQPRGLTKEHAGVDLWLKDIAPTAGLRTGVAMTRTAGVSFNTDASRSSVPITPRSITDLASRAKSPRSLVRATPSTTTNAAALADYLAEH